MKKKPSHPLSRCVRLLVLGYRAFLSPFLPPRCRFYPSCSAYALQAFSLYGPLRAARLTFRRLARCHPFHPGGVDFLPSSHPAPLPVEDAPLLTHEE